MDSKILVAVELLVLVCLFSLESASCSTKGFQITRDSRDSFKIPPSKCDSTNQSFDYCAEYNAKKDREKTPCDCVCDASSSTFEFRNNAWSCQKNNETRASFGQYHVLLIVILSFQKIKQEVKKNGLKQVYLTHVILELI